MNPIANAVAKMLNEQPRHVVLQALKDIERLILENNSIDETINTLEQVA